jgi:hypothetical protein
MAELQRLKEKARRLKVRVTKNVNGKRVALSVEELRNAVNKASTKVKIQNANAIVGNIVNDVKKEKVRRRRNVFVNAQDELENIFFNANNTPFNLRNDTENAIKTKSKTALIDKAMPKLKVKGASKSFMDKMKAEAVKTADHIRSLIVEGKIAKAIYTLSVLFVVYKLYQNPTLMDRQVLDHVRKIPYLRPVLSNPKEGKVAWFLSLMGAKPTETQLRYEFFMSNQLNNTQKGLSMAGAGMSYLAMVILSLVSVLPYKKLEGRSKRVLDYIFTQLQRYAPVVGSLVLYVMAERYSTSKQRTIQMYQAVPAMLTQIGTSYATGGVLGVAKGAGAVGLTALKALKT